MPESVKPREAPTVDLCEDRAWLDGFRAGDAAALERVFRTYAPLVHRLLRGGAKLADGTRVYLQGLMEEDDLLQDVFVRLLSAPARARYDGLRPYGALVRVVTRNTLVDHLRRFGRLKDREVTVEDPAEMPQADPGNQQGPLSLLLSQEEAELAESLRQFLTPEERTLAQVRYEEGLSQRDAAHALGISRQNLRTLETRLLARARAFLKERGW